MLEYFMCPKASFFFEIEDQYFHMSWSLLHIFFFIKSLHTSIEYSNSTVSQNLSSFVTLISFSEMRPIASFDFRSFAYSGNMDCKSRINSQRHTSIAHAATWYARITYDVTDCNQLQRRHAKSTCHDERAAFMITAKCFAV